MDVIIKFEEKQIFFNYDFYFYGMSEEIETEFKKIVQELGAIVSSSKSSRSYTLMDCGTYEEKELDDGPYYNIKFISDSIDANKALDIQNYLFTADQLPTKSDQLVTLNSEPACYYAKYILRTNTCYKYFYKNEFGTKFSLQDKNDASVESLSDQESSVENTSCKSSEKSNLKRKLVTSPNLKSDEKRKLICLPSCSSSVMGNETKPKTKSSGSSSSSSSNTSEEDEENNSVADDYNNEIISLSDDSLNSKESAKNLAQNKNTISSSSSTSRASNAITNNGNANKEVNLTSDDDEDGSLNKWVGNKPVPENLLCNVKNCTLTKNPHKRHESFRVPFSRFEQIFIIKYLIQNKCIDDAKGVLVWRKMLLNGIMTHRTVQSLNNHFRKFILKDIKTFKLPKIYEKKFLLLKSQKDNKNNKKSSKKKVINNIFKKN